MATSLGAAPTSGFEVAADPFEIPRFFLEALRVQGNERVTDEIVVAESLLVAGHAYDELDLADAIARIERLPFVLDARFSLERGSERGRYVLVVEIEEVRRFFFGDELQVTRFGGDREVALGDALAGDSYSANPLAGARFFFGRHHEVFGSVAIGRGVQLGYNRYDLFGRRMVLSVGLTAQRCCPSEVFSLGLDPTFAAWEGSGERHEVRAALGVPLGGTRQVRVSASWADSERGFRFAVLGERAFRRPFEYRDLVQETLEIAWSDDSTDDPIFPSRGRSLTLALDFQRIEADLFAPAFTFPGSDLNLPDGVEAGDALPSMRSEEARLAAVGTRHWSLGRRHTLSVTARLAVGVGRVEDLSAIREDCSEGVFGACNGDLLLLGDDSFELYEASLRLRHAVRFLSDRFHRERGDLRLETTVQVGWDDVSAQLGLDGDPLERTSAGIALVYRNHWGLFRAGFQVVDYRGGA